MAAGTGSDPFPKREERQPRVVVSNERHRRARVLIRGDGGLIEVEAPRDVVDRALPNALRVRDGAGFPPEWFRRD